MYVRMKETLATAIAAFYAGKIYDVPTETGEIWIDRDIAVETGIPPEWIAEFLARLDIGEGKPCIHLPHLGEFGHRITSGIRLIHFNRASEKIVCCRPGEEVLYPSASGFVTDWIDPTPDSTRAGSMRSPASLWPDIIARFPNHMPIEQGGLTRDQELIDIHPTERIPFKPRCRGLRADVILGCRFRHFHNAKNFNHWQRVADSLKAEGITYAVVGERSTSFDLKGQEWHSGDFDTDAAIEGMQNCALYLGTDTGSAHLAAAVGCKQLVIREPFFGRDFIVRMEAYNPGNVHRIEGAWEEPDKIATRAMELLSSADTRPRTALGMFDRAYVINLDTAPDRLERITGRLQRLGIEFERLPASVASDQSHHAALRACALSHLRIIRQAEAEQLASVLIIEDDAIFRDDTPKIMRYVADEMSGRSWDLLYLGIDERDRASTTQLSHHLTNVIHGFQTHAYAVHSRAYKTVIRYLERCVNGEFKSPVEGKPFPFDCFHCPVTKLAVKPILAIQETGTSSITGQYMDRRELYFPRFGEFKSFQEHCPELLAVPITCVTSADGLQLSTPAH